LTCKFQSFISIIILVVKFAWVVDCVNDPSKHESHVSSFLHIRHVKRPIVKLDVRQNNLIKDVLDLLLLSLLATHHALAYSQLGGKILHGLELCEDVKLRPFLERKTQLFQVFRFSTYHVSYFLIGLHSHGFEDDSNRDVIAERVLLEIELAILIRDGRSCLLSQSR